MQSTPPLDVELNAAILTIAARLFPCGYLISEDAPDTYDKLVVHLDCGKPLVVFAGGSEQTIYGDREVNYAFRAWHDWCHWRGGHPFNREGEQAVYAMQCQHLVQLYDYSLRTRRWFDILYAEIIGQQLYFEQHRQFPADQRAFVERFLAGLAREQIIAAE